MSYLDKISQFIATLELILGYISTTRHSHPVLISNTYHLSSLLGLVFKLRNIIIFTIRECTTSTGWKVATVQNSHPVLSILD
jgi:hypothetical protein